LDDEQPHMAGKKSNRIEYIPSHKLMMSFKFFGVTKEEWGVEENSSWILKSDFIGIEDGRRERERDFGYGRRQLGEESV